MSAVCKAIRQEWFPTAASAEDILAFEEKFQQVGINIHHPQNGHLLESKKHNKNSYQYNKKWEAFFDKNKSYTKEQVIDKAKEIMKEVYGE